MNPADSLLIGFKSHLRVESVPAEAVYLFSDHGVTALSGSCIARLAPLLDGTRAIGQLASELAPELAFSDVEETVARLAKAGLVEYRHPGSAGRDVAAVAYWTRAGLDAEEAVRALREASVEIISVGDVDAAGADSLAAQSLCEASGLTVRAGDEDAAMSLVLCGDYLDPRLAAVNARHLATRRPWLLVKPGGAQAWLGPVFQPGAGACLACLTARLEANRNGALLMKRVLGASAAFGEAPRVSLAASRGAALQLAVLEIAKWLAGVRHDGQRAIYDLDTLTLRGRHHDVSRRPQCPACGSHGMIAAQAGRAPVFTCQVITSASGNGQRAVSPERMLVDYGHLVDPVTGVVAELSRDTRVPDSHFAFVSGRNRALMTDTVAGLKAGLRFHSGGKGATEAEAKAGALCEAVERHCGTRQGDELVVRDSFSRLGADAVHPGECLLFDERQYAGRAEWNASCAPFHRVPEPFDETSVMEWTPVWSLVTGGQRLLPTGMLYFARDGEAASACVRADSNGNAAGSSLEDAVQHGFLELVERDAVALWWYNRTRQREVGLTSFEDPWISRVPELYRKLGREVWVLDLTSDLGIPVMAAVSRRTDKAAEDITFGFGAHFDPRIALRRALTELGQLLPAVAGVRADGSGYALDEPHLMSWWARATVSNQPYLRPEQGAPARTAADYGYAARGDIDIDDIRAVGERAGLDILVLNQTRPDIKMPVVKVVIPGLRHFWPRFAPGRLFQVPVALGRKPAMTEYSDLNPIPLYV
jgi:oxazoline/thiazoline synthase